MRYICVLLHWRISIASIPHQHTLVCFLCIIPPFSLSEFPTDVPHTSQILVSIHVCYLYDSWDGGDNSDEEILCDVKSPWGRVRDQLGRHIDWGGYQSLFERGVTQHTVGGCFQIFMVHSWKPLFCIYHRYGVKDNSWQRMPLMFNF